LAIGQQIYSRYHTLNFNPPETIRLFPLRDSAVVPIYGTKGSACFDISAAFELGLKITVFDQTNHKDQVEVSPELEFSLLPKERALIPTGWVFGIPHGYSIRFHPRSGIAWKNGVSFMNAEAVIDEDYVDESFIMLHNHSTERFTIKNGDRIAQGELVETVKTKFHITSIRPTNNTDRIGGIGSTGI